MIFTKPSYGLLATSFPALQISACPPEAHLYFKNLTWIGSLSFCLAACASDPNDPDLNPDGSGGLVGSSGGASSGGAVGNSGGAANSGGGPSTGGSGATTGTGGMGSGGILIGSGGGGAASGGSSGEGSGGGGDVGPGPSDLPAPPGDANIPRPSGTPGDITVIDWAGFPAAVTYSFDDNDSTQLDHYAEMHAIGGRYTYYLVTSNFGVAITDPRWKAIYDDGNEIGNHTTNHSCGTSQIDGANTSITTTFGRAPSTLAAPNGDDACQNQAVGRVFINREVGPSTPVKPLDNSNPFAMNCYIPATGQAAKPYNDNIDSALSQNGWVIYVIHGINPGTSHTFQPVSWDGLKSAIEYSKSKDVWIDTMENVGSYWLGQKAFASAMTATAGTDKTWTWTLPDNFPEGKYLRVTVDGGTLKQDGTPLTWDPHGYYEVALDTKSVTLSP